MSSEKTTTITRRQRIFLVLAITILLIAGISAFTQTPLYRHLTATKLIYSQSAAVNETWSTYKAEHIEAGSNRTLDSHATNVTSSTSQANTMLRSVWIDDKKTFDASWKWSLHNDQLTNKLFASSYGPRADGTYGYISTTTDSVADTNIALSLLMAYSRWNDTKDLGDAEAIIGALYQTSVVTANGSPIMASTSVDTSASSIHTSPAVFNVAAYKEFAKVDPSHDWTSLATNSYATMARLLALNNNQLPSAATIHIATGDITMSEQNKVFNGDAATGVWNLGLDYTWNKDSRDLTLMKKLPLAAEYHSTGKILAGSANESAATYAKLLPYFKAIDPSAAPSVYDTKLLALYSQDDQAWATKLSLSDETWTWLSIEYYNGQLRQLTEQS